MAWQDDIDLHHRPARIADVVQVLMECWAKVPGGWVGRSGNGIGNLCVYDSEGRYVGVVTLGSHPSLDMFESEEQ